jgi:hypothetical protein
MHLVGAAGAPAIAVIPLEFLMFALVLGMIAFSHASTVASALWGALAITLYKVGFSPFHEGAGLAQSTQVKHQQGFCARIYAVSGWLYLRGLEASGLCRNVRLAMSSSASWSMDVAAISSSSDGNSGRSSE